MLIRCFPSSGILVMPRCFLPCGLASSACLVPDEVIVMTGGALTANGFLHVLPAFMLTYLGVVSGLSLGYVLG